MTLSKKVCTVASTLALSLLAAPSAALAADWYVASRGGCGDGTSATQPACSLYAVLDACAPGDVVHLGEGTFSVNGESLNGCSLVGAGPSRTTLEQSHTGVVSDELLVVNDGVVQVRDLTLSSGVATPLLVQGWNGARPSVDLRNVNIDGGQVGVYAYDADVTIARVTFSNVRSGVLVGHDAAVSISKAQADGGTFLDVVSGSAEVRNSDLTDSDVIVRGSATLVLDKTRLVGRSSVQLTGNGSGRITNTILDTSGYETPIEIGGGSWTIAHNTIIKPAAVLCAPGSYCPPVPPAVHCQPAGDWTGSISFQANVVLGFSYGIRMENGGYKNGAFVGWGNGTRCSLETVESAYYWSLGSVKIDTFAGWGNLEKPFQLTSSYAPSSATSPLVDVITARPTDTTNLLKDFEGKARSWPADIGAVEHTP
ncbi:MAG: hypothetical protein U0271_03995 [Polyangiaceae bacterium]